jgi:hypothetical protein
MEVEECEACRKDSKGKHVEIRDQNLSGWNE